MIKLEDWEQQIVLACKHHGKITKRNRLKGIKYILAITYGLEMKYVTDDTVYRALWGIAYKLKINTQIIIENLFQDSWTGERKEFIDKTHINKKLISEISLIQVKDDNKNILIELIPNNDILNGKRIKEWI